MVLERYAVMVTVVVMVIKQGLDLVTTRDPVTVSTT